MSAGERTSEGYAPDGALSPDPVGKPDPETLDPQITQMVIDRLRDGIAFPAGVKTIAQVIEWVEWRHQHPVVARSGVQPDEEDLLIVLKAELKLASDLGSSTAVFERIRDHEVELERLQQKESAAAATQMYAAVEGGSVPTNGKAPTTPYGDLSAGPVSDMLSTLQASAGQDPDAHHRRDAAAIDDAHTQSFADNPPGPPPPYGIPPGTPSYTMSAFPPDEQEKPHQQQPFDRYPGGKASGSNLMSTFVSDMLAQSDLDAPSAFDILSVCMEMAIFLMSKNKQYGDSALDPVRIMSSADPAEQLRVRMDDKLSRMFRGDKVKEDEDVFKDLVGYWVLMRVAEKRAGG